MFAFCCLRVFGEYNPIQNGESTVLLSPTTYFPCKICNHSVTAPYYVCNSCKYYVHKSCLELPQHINLYFHPHHRLTLFQESYMCYCCGQYFQNALTFHCDQCGFNLDVECAMMSNSTTACPKGQEHCTIQHSSHPHLLLLVDPEINKEMEIKCFACKIKRSAGGGLYYGCKRCKYYLHKQCMDELPQEIQNPIHPHLLSLRATLFGAGSLCEFCDKKIRGKTFYFKCTQCHFMLCIRCGVKVVIRINCEDHDHPLYFVEKVCDALGQCNAFNCYRKLSVKFNEVHVIASPIPIFRCMDCNFKLHLLCGPLPSTINHKCHVDHLILVDSFVEDDSGEYVCDVCETKRDPRVRVYCCYQCKYIAHVECVIFEVRHN